MPACGDIDPPLPVLAIYQAGMVAAAQFPVTFSVADSQSSSDFRTVIACGGYKVLLKGETYSMRVIFNIEKAAIGHEYSQF